MGKCQILPLKLGLSKGFLVFDGTYDDLDVTDYGAVSHLQANKDYAVWLQLREDMDGYALTVYDYKEKRLYDIADKEFPVLEENLLLHENFLMIGKPYTEVTIYNLDTREVTAFD